MSTFPDGLYQWGGVPVSSGQIPVTYGNYYFVDYDNGADGNSGTKMDKAKKTLAAAYALTTSNNNDVIVLSANSEHTLTAKLTVSNNRVHFVGLDTGGRYYGQRARVTLGTTTTITSTMRVTGVGCTFRNIKFSNASNQGTQSFCVEDGGEYALFENCEFYKSDDMDKTACAELLANGDSSLYKHCTFGSLTTATSSGDINRPVVLFDREIITGKVARDNMFVDCLFWRKAGHVNNIFIEATAADDAERMVLFKGCTFVANILGEAMVNVVESALTNAHMMFIDCHAVNCGSWATSATNAGVYVSVQEPTSTTSLATTHQGLMVQAT